MEATRRRTWPLMGELQTNRDPALFPGSMSSDSRPIHVPSSCYITQSPMNCGIWFVTFGIEMLEDAGLLEFSNPIAFACALRIQAAILSLRFNVWNGLGW